MIMNRKQSVTLDLPSFSDDPFLINKSVMLRLQHPKLSYAEAVRAYKLKIVQIISNFSTQKSFEEASLVQKLWQYVIGGLANGLIWQTV